MKPIITIGDGKTFLTPDQITLPSIIQTQPAPTTSSKYCFFSTMALIQALAEHKWHPVRIQEQHVRTQSKEGFQKHMVRFRQEGTYLSNVGDIAPEFIITNSHNGTYQYDTMAGIFRLACLNGMIVSEANFSRFRIRHLKQTQEDVIEASYKVLDSVPQLVNDIKHYQTLPLSAKKAEVFADAALTLKYDPSHSARIVRSSQSLQIGDRTFLPHVLITPRRAQDEPRTLWNVFNTVQEKLINGDNSYEASVYTLPNGRVIKKSKTLPITSIAETIRVNQGLWSLMAEFKLAA